MWEMKVMCVVTGSPASVRKEELMIHTKCVCNILIGHLRSRFAGYNKFFVAVMVRQSVTQR